MNTQHTFVHEQDFYEVSEKGIVELRDAGTKLSATELQILVLMNGRTTVARIAERLGEPMEAARAIFADLRRRDLITPSSTHALAGVDDVFNLPLATGGAAGATIKASEQAESGASVLESTGYYVAIARRGAGAQKPREGNSRTVLVVDDDSSTASLMARHLEYEGFLVRLATNREEIVAALRRLPVPDLALLDIMMPDADGFDVLSRVRMHPVLKVMPVVMMTGLATREAVLKGLQLGADGYVTKPVNHKVLLRVVRNVLGPEESG